MMDPIPDAQIDEIMDYVDFGKIHKAMVALDWKWGKYVPDEPEIRSAARRLLRQCNTPYLGTGGLVVRRGEGEASLSFEVSSWTTGEVCL